MKNALPLAAIACLALVAPSRIRAAETPVLTTVADLLRAQDNPRQVRYTFDLTGGVRRIWKGRDFILTDNTGSASMIDYASPLPPDGTRVRVTGKFSSPSGNWIPRGVSTCTVLGADPPARPTDVTLAELVSTTPDFSYIRTEATVSDIRPDDISAKCLRILLTDGTLDIQAALPVDAPQAIRSASRLLGARIRLTGVFFLQRSGGRQFDSKLIMLDDTADAIEILHTATDPFDCPELGFREHVPPEKLIGLGRRTQTGTVLAVWQGDRFLLEADDIPEKFIARLIQVHLANGETPPAVGDRVNVVGDVTTDRFQLILTRAKVRFLARATPTEKAPVETKLTDILPHPKKPFVNDEFRGETLVLRGTVRTLPSDKRLSGQTLLEADGRSIVVDATAHPETLDSLQPGTEIQATGVLVIEADIWHADAPFTRVNRCLFALRRPSDLVVLSRPSPLTPRVFGWVTGALVLCLIAVFIWNRLLNHLVERRSRELTREQVSRLTETLRVDERTRLAVELHDSLSQNLSGVAFQVGAALALFKSDVRAAGELLLSVQRMLLSCRGELKRCLWDLREDTLSERDFAVAIERTLRPVIGAAALRLRFNIDRARLHDATAHAILCIIRELAANAVHHGRATILRIAGECHDEMLSFSVRDNGCGFDVERQRRSDGTHFGLQGIRERVRHLAGTFSIVSEPGDTRAEVSIPLPTDPILTK